MDDLAGIGKYATVVIDPPWPYGGIGWTKNTGYEACLDYPTMSLTEIAAMPIREALADDAYLFVWTVNRFIRETYDLLAGWGVDYKFTMTWVKGGGTQFPGGPCFNSEWCIVGQKGKPQFMDTRAFSLANTWPRRGHSTKPEEFYDLLRRVTPGPRLDIFNRRVIAGFASWGNEAPATEVLPDHWQIPMEA